MAKYVIVKDEEFGRIEVPLIFDSYLSHQTMARGLNAIAAGFVEIRGLKRDRGDREDLSVHCYGESLSLGIKSRGRVDSSVIIESLHRKDA